MAYGQKAERFVVEARVRSVQQIMYCFKAYLLRDAPTGLIFKNCTLCPHCIYLRTNSGLCHLHNKLIGFHDLGEKCLLRGTDCVFK